MRARGLLAAAALAVALVVVPVVAADDWWPHPSDATWTYQWTDSVYATTPTSEKVTVSSVKGSTFVLAWTTDGMNNPDGAIASAGTMTFQETNGGINATDWSSTPPPSTFPVLCASAASCPNALSATLYNVIWGSRNPALTEPLLQGATWTSTGGGANDVSSGSTYLGTEQVSVPAFPGPVTAAKIQTQISQAGALGDPYGSGLRTVWWVYGVGPVKIVFQHAGGANAPLTTATLQSTSLTPKAPPSDVDWFPFKKGLSLTYRWTNTKHLRKPEVDRFTVDAVLNGTARFKAQSISGPIKLVGTYGFSKRLDGVTNLWGTTQSATLLKFPPLGPRNAPVDKRPRLLSPFDLMTFGFNPILTAYPAVGDNWSASTSGLDFAEYGVTGAAKIVGTRKVKVPAGTFQALVVRSTLKQPGFPYGSGTRTAWFAPGKGLVKLVFAHADHSVSTVELLK